MSVKAFLVGAISFAATIHGANVNSQTSINLAEAAMVNNGGGYFDISRMNDLGTLTDVCNTTGMKPFEEVKKRGQASFLENLGQDGETWDVVTRYFWGKTNGVAIELGAVDGIHNSQTKLLEDSLGWHRILIDANPVRAAKLKTNAPKALSYVTAVCVSSRIVHYAMRGDVSGIVEFMAPPFVKHFYPELYQLPSSEWVVKHPDLVKEIPALPMSVLLHHANVSHVNYFLLDTEGAELEILKTIAWSEVTFDVISVETERALRKPGFEAKVRAYLASKGYIYDRLQGRNTWYVHVGYKPSSVALCV